MDRKEMQRQAHKFLENKGVVTIKQMINVYQVEKLLVEYHQQQLALHSVSNRFSDPKFIDNVCLSYRHDFGFLNEEEQNKVRFECKEWMRAIKNNEPY